MAPDVLDALPEHVHPWYSHNANRSSREAREDILREIVDVLARIVATELTPRQQEILLLYYANGLTEAQIAAVLRVSQPTISQHLTGKKRRGKKVGGALRKLRKGIRRAASEWGQPVRDRQIIAVLNNLLDEPLTRTHAARLFDSLRDTP